MATTGPTPARPDDADLALCADLGTSEVHCGACNNPCLVNWNCIDGVCRD